MKTGYKKTTVAGKEYTVYGDLIKCGVFAINEEGEVKQISFSGYITKDLTIRKAIKDAFNLDTFRK